jgi:hypothetical protein
MRTIALLILVFVFASVSGSAATPNAPEYYPWSETSEYVRVPKSFLTNLNVTPITITNFETWEFVLTEEFAKVFKLTTLEIRGVTKSLADALHEYRTAEGKSFVPTTETNFGPFKPNGLPEGDEKFHFRLNEFPEEDKAIRGRIRDKTREILGEQRSEYFWQFASIHLEGEMSVFTNKRPSFQEENSTTFTFMLKENPPGIDLFKSTLSWGAGGPIGGSVGGRPYTKPLDKYAPEMMKPILVRWRKSIVTNAKENTVSASNASNEEKPSSSTSETNPSLSAEKWDEQILFYDLPKTQINSMQVAGLTDEYEISPEAVALYGLSDSDRKAVITLYHDLRVRFENIERAHFERTKPGENKFVLRAFPEKAAVLQGEWSEKLSQLLGRNRAEFLDESIRTPLIRHPMMRRMMRRGGHVPLGLRHLRFGDRGPDWLHRGTEEIRIDVTFENGPDGQPKQRIRQEGEPGGTSITPRGQIPERWRHLLTSDMLEPSLLF